MSDEDQVDQVARAIEDGEELPPPPDELELAGLERNDVGNGQRLLARHGHNLLDVAEAGWHVWGGKRWELSIGQRGGPGAEVLRVAHDAQARIASEAEALKGSAPKLPGPHDTSLEAERTREIHAAVLAQAGAHRKFGIASGNHGKIEGMLKSSAPYRRRLPEDFDSDPCKFNVANGTLHLDGEQVELRPHARRDLITHISPVAYDPEATCPKFHKYLDRVQPDVEQQKFLQVWGGYCLSGLTIEQVLTLHYGIGSNGKTVLLELWLHIFGDYGATVPIATFMQEQHSRGAGDATPDIARLPGMRLVVASEPEKNARLAESVVKTATGGGKMTARRLFEGQFEFTPNFKLNIDANNKPLITGQDEGIWRRVLMCPWPVFLEKHERNKKLRFELMAEAPGILNWLLDGWRMYRESGLYLPDTVLAAIDEYRQESDPLRSFIATCLRAAPGGRISRSRLYAAYERWCKANALDPMKGNAFGRAMTQVGIRRETVGVVFYCDVEIIEEALEDLEESGPPSDDPRPP